MKHFSSRAGQLSSRDLAFFFGGCRNGAAGRPLLTRLSTRSRQSSVRNAFTLIELLVVITIIAVLIGILVPVIAKVRIKSREADTRNFIIQLSGAIERYQTDFRAYPGPIPNADITLPSTRAPYNPGGGYTSFAVAVPTGVTAGVGGFDVTTQDNSTLPETWTMSENLVLGLLGGLHKSSDPAKPAELDYDPSAVGGGPTSLNPSGIPKRYPAYIDGTQLSWQIGASGKSGHYFDSAGAANDSMIPEFVDRFTDPMPIIYMRAKIGANAAPPGTGTFTNGYNPIITDDLPETNANGVRAGQFDTSQYIAYTGAYTGSWPTLTLDTAMPPTGASIGVGRSAKSSKYTVPPTNGILYHGLFSTNGTSWTAPTYPTMTSGSGATYNYPFIAYPYFTGSAGVAREKDAYILISAGADRVYGTEDDIANFGTVGE